VLRKVAEGSPHVVDAIRSKTIGLLVNTTEGSKGIRDSYSMRRHTLLANIPYFTTMSAALAVVQAIEAEREETDVGVRSLQEWHQET
jgi:carbamoyl-phosphate synthase large subunit